MSFSPVMNADDSPVPRRPRSFRELLLCALALAGSSLPAAPLPGETGKENLLVFTGLGWDDRSRKLRDEAMGDPEFLGALRGSFVLTHIDLPETPRDENSLTDAEARDYRLARDLKLRVFPSIYLCTTGGQPYGLVACGEEGPGVLAKAILEKRSAHAKAMRGIDRLEGADRARAIDSWLGTLPEPLRILHRDKIENLIASDPEDVTGLRSKHQLALAIPEARRLRYTGKLEEAERQYLKIIAEVEPEGEALQQIHYELADVHFQRKDYDRLLDTLDLAIEAAPQGERMEVLREMMEVFTRQWILMRCKPGAMQAVNYDHKKVTLAPGDTAKLLETIDEAKRCASGSTRNRTLDAMADELRAAGGGK
jgi:tetratricopeptide (TPR) repeat protein